MIAMRLPRGAAARLGRHLRGRAEHGVTLAAMAQCIATVRTVESFFFPYLDETARLSA